MKIIMRVTKFNKNTMAVLGGAISVDAPGLLESVVYHSSALDCLNAAGEADILFVYSFTTPQAADAFKEFGFIREKFPNAVIVAGGPHASGDPDSAAASGADYVITGEGETAFTSLLKSLAAGSSPKHGVIRGAPVDFSLYPAFPFNDPDRALYIELTRGCPYQCSFCQTSSIFGTRPRHRTPDSVLENAEMMLKHKLSDLRFVTPNALSYGSVNGITSDPAALKGLLENLSELCLPHKGRIFLGSFPSEIRPEFVTKELMQLLKAYVSNDNVIIGAQSGSDKVLRATGRNHTTETVFNAVRTSIEAGFRVNVDFLFGFTAENDEKESLKSIALMESLLKLGARIHAHKLIPVAGTDYYRQIPPPQIHPKILQFLNNNHGKGLIYGNF